MLLHPSHYLQNQKHILHQTHLPLSIALTKFSLTVFETLTSDFDAPLASDLLPPLRTISSFRITSFKMSLRYAGRSIIRSLNIVSTSFPLSSCRLTQINPSSQMISISCNYYNSNVVMSKNFSSLIIGSLTDTRYPKRKPGTKPRRKRASLKPKGPYAWVQYVPGEPIPTSRPNKGSVRGRKEKKRIAQRKAFILSEKKKRKAQFRESKKKKAMEIIERKMAAVARDKAWAERLVVLQKLEAEKMAAKA